MARLLLTVNDVVFGGPTNMYPAEAGVGPGAAFGAKFPCRDLSTFLMCVCQGPGAGHVIVKAQRTTRPGDTVFPPQAVADLRWVVDDDESVTVFGPFRPAYISADGFVEFNVEDDGAGNDIGYQFKVIRLV